MSIIEKIKAHEQEVLSAKYPTDLNRCPNCKGIPQALKPHHKKKRLFLVILEEYVQKIWSLLGRWKCLLCDSTFTYYPDYAIANKRYVRDDVLRLSHSYVEDDDTTYRKVGMHKGFPIGYENEGRDIDDRQLWGSTVHRWISYIGLFEKALREALNLIRQKSPLSEVFRELRPIHPRKYRSERRKKVFSLCIRLFITEEEFRKLFDASIFTKFATGGL